MEEAEEVKRLMYLEAVTASISTLDCVQITRRMNRKFDSQRRMLGGEVTMSGKVSAKRGKKRIEGCASGLERCLSCSSVFIAGVNLEVRAQRGGGITWKCLTCQCSIKSVAEKPLKKKFEPGESSVETKNEGNHSGGRKKNVKGLKSLLKAKREKSQQSQNPALGYFLRQ